MKRLIYYMIPVLILSISGCRFLSGSGLDLRLKLEKGDSYLVVADATQSINQKVGEMEMNMVTQVKMCYTYHVIDTDKEGNFDIRQTFDRIVFNTTFGDFSMEYDSDLSVDDSTSQFAGLDALIGAEVISKISPHGKALEIKGAQELLDRMFSSLDKENSDNSHALLDSFKKMFDEEGLIKSSDQSFAYLPGKPVKVGDSWNSGLRLDAGISIELSNIYLLKSREDGVAVIGVNSVMLTDTLTIETEDSPADVSFSMKGSMSGTFRVNEASGMVNSGNIEGNFSGDIEAPLMPGTDPVKIPMTLTTSAKYTMEKK